MSKYIVSNTASGIGNRLQCLFSLMNISEKCGAGFFFCWPINQFCKIPFSQLFSGYQEFQVSNINDLYKFEQLDTILTVNRISNIFYRNYFNHDMVIINHGYLYSTQESVIESDRSLVKDKLAKLEPSEQIRQMYNSVVDEDISRLSCVHVRGGILGIDNVKRLDLSAMFIPIDRYFEYIEGNLDRFVLVCEREEILEQFRKRYGKRVVSFPIVEDFKNREFALYSVRDMYIMSQCKKIIGAVSSFSDIASMWGSVEKKLIIKENANKNVPHY